MFISPTEDYTDRSLKDTCSMESASGDWLYKKNISRKEAEERLKVCENGEFLVRDSQNFEGDYTLSIQLRLIPVIGCMLIIFLFGVHVVMYQKWSTTVFEEEKILFSP